MKKTYAIILLVPFLLSIGCAEEKKEGLIPGVELTGDALTDALVLAVVANPPCTILTSSNGSTAVDLSDGFDSICSSTTAVASFTVPNSGEYEVIGTTGRQTLTSPRCNSSNFTIHVQLDQGLTVLYSTSNTPNQAVTLNLTAGTSYTLYGSGIVDPGDYSCSGARPSSSITPYRINIRKK